MSVRRSPTPAGWPLELRFWGDIPIYRKSQHATNAAALLPLRCLRDRLCTLASALKGCLARREDLLRYYAALFTNAAVMKHPATKGVLGCDQSPAALLNPAAAHLSQCHVLGQTGWTDSGCSRTENAFGLRWVGSTCPTSRRQRPAGKRSPRTGLAALSRPQLSPLCKRRLVSLVPSGRLRCLVASALSHSQSAGHRSRARCSKLRVPVPPLPAEGKVNAGNPFAALLQPGVAEKLQVRAPRASPPATV